MYQTKRMKFKNCIEVYDYHSARYGAPGRKREKKKKPTPEQIERQNQKNRERKARWRLREYFEKNDYFTTLTYRKEERPEDMKGAQKDIRRMLENLRRAYEKAGVKMRYMMNIEVGTKGAWHVHIILKRIPDLDILLAKYWKKGKVINQLLYQKGEFKDLAAYITKTPKTDKRLRETKYSNARDMPLRDPEVKTYRRWKTFTKVRVPKGWYLDKDSYCEGVNIFGFPYRSYTLMRIERRE